MNEIEKCGKVGVADAFCLRLAPISYLIQEVHHIISSKIIKVMISKAGQAEEGLSVLVEALAIAENTGERNWEAELHRQKGQLLLALSEENHQAEAEACFHKAVSIARRQSATSLELRAVMSLSQL